MTDQPTTGARIPGWAKLLITIAVVAGASTLIWTQLPRGHFSTDLTLIGQGQPALVMARDIAYLEGAEVMDRMNAIRDDYADVLFLVAHLGRPEGREFARRFEARDATVILFDAQGQALAILRAPPSAQVIRQALDTHLGS